MFQARCVKLCTWSTPQVAALAAFGFFSLVMSNTAARAQDSGRERGSFDRQDGGRRIDGGFDRQVDGIDRQVDSIDRQAWREFDGMFRDRVADRRDGARDQSGFRDGPPQGDFGFRDGPPRDSFGGGGFGSGFARDGFRGPPRDGFGGAGFDGGFARNEFSFRDGSARGGFGAGFGGGGGFGPPWAGAGRYAAMSHRYAAAMHHQYSMAAAGGGHRHGKHGHHYGHHRRHHGHGSAAFRAGGNRMARNFHRHGPSMAGNDFRRPGPYGFQHGGREMMAQRDYWQRDFGRGPAWQQSGRRRDFAGDGDRRWQPPMARDGGPMGRDGGPMARGGFMERDGGPMARGDGPMARNGRADGGDGNRPNSDVEARLDSIERRLDSLMRLISQEHDQQPHR